MSKLCLLAVGLLLSVCNSAFAQYRIYSGSAQVGVDTVPIVLYASAQSGRCYYSGRCNAPQRYNKEGPVTRTTISACMVENTNRGEIQMSFSYYMAGMIGSPTVGYATSGAAFGPTMTLDLIGAGVWAAPLPASITLTSGSTSTPQPY